MKRIPLFAVALLTGCFQSVPVSTLPQTATEPEPVAESLVPRATLETTTCDAGETSYGETRTCTFPITNTGTAPLQLTLDRRSCSCGEVDVPTDPIPPGGKVVATIRWSPIPGNVGPYRLTAEVQTNDPDAPVLRLEVQGVIVPLVRVLPESWSFVDFRTFGPGQIVERELKLVSSKLETFDLKTVVSHPGLKWSASPLKPEPGEGGFRSGYAVKLTTSAELPAGYFRESVTFTITASDSRSWNISLPVYGEVENGVLQVLPREVVFRKPFVRESDSRKMQLQFIVPSADESVKVVGCEPSFLKCDEPKRLKPGMWELTVRLPADDPDAMKYQPDAFFEGKLLLEVTGSKTPVPVRIKWIGRNE